MHVDSDGHITASATTVRNSSNSPLPTWCLLETRSPRGPRRYALRTCTSKALNVILAGAQTAENKPTCERGHTITSGAYSLRIPRNCTLTRRLQRSPRPPASWAQCRSERFCPERCRKRDYLLPSETLFVAPIHLIGCNASCEVRIERWTRFTQYLSRFFPWNAIVVLMPTGMRTGSGSSNWGHRLSCKNQRASMKHSDSRKTSFRHISRSVRLPP